MRNLSQIALFAVLLGLASCDTFRPAGTPRGTAPNSKVAPAMYTSSDRNVDYVTNFKNSAIMEMERGGVPASIILAQGILESGAGSSDLAQSANNHFGIKCSSNWNGSTYYKKDDDRDASGNLKESCFRKYKDVSESFHDHAEFLRDPKKYNRYGFLFNLSKTDYKGWARGLQSAGYATNPTYSDQLVNLIERYELYKYDQQASAGTPPGTGTNPNGTPTQPSLPVITPNGPEVPAAQRIGRVNDVKVVLSRNGESLSDISNVFNLNTDKVVNYNDHGYTPGFRLKENTRIFIQPKKDKWRGRTAEHFVREGQTMFDISQIYGVKLDKLINRNNMQKGEEPAINEKVCLRGTRERNNVIQLRNLALDPVKTDPAVNPPVNPMPNRPVTTDSGNGEELPFEIGGDPQPAKPSTPTQPGKPSTTWPTNPSTTPQPPANNGWGTPTTPTNPPTGNGWGSTPNSPTQPTNPDGWGPTPTNPPPTPGGWTKPTTPTTPTVPADGFHTVVKGDTLFNISRRYNQTPLKIKQLNNMTDDVVKIGQRLRVK